MDNPVTGFSILFEEGGARQPETFQYTQHIWYYRDPQSFTVVRIAGLIDFFTFHTYSATALFFAIFSFSGAWFFYKAVVQKYPGNERKLAVAILFIPSVVFWGSGILKDTITFGALGWLTYCVINIIDFQRLNIKYWVIGACMAVLIFKIKSYIVICFIPMLFVWLYWKYQVQIKSAILRVLIAPVLLMIFVSSAYFSLDQVSSYSEKYSLDAIAERAAITAYDIRYGWGARTGGDGGYDIGIPDGSWQSMISLAPKAIVVSLFRPFLWEVKNPLMLLSALESIIITILVSLMLVKGKWKRIVEDPFLLFCLFFALLFGFAVGISTGNFGTLMRYKIPMMPFFFTFLMLALDKREKKYGE
ncbi:hypothetical protein [Marinoscillum furvescens]|nr:hypothetical protein [Marinoscillum furvescens]